MGGFYGYTLFPPSLLSPPLPFFLSPLLPVSGPLQFRQRARSILFTADAILAANKIAVGTKKDEEDSPAKWHSDGRMKLNLLLEKVDQAAYLERIFCKI